MQTVPEFLTVSGIKVRVTFSLRLLAQRKQLSFGVIKGAGRDEGAARCQRRAAFRASRFGDITLPLLKIVRLVAPKREAELLKLFTEMEKGRLNEKSRSLEGDILIALLALESEVNNGKLPLSFEMAVSPFSWWS